MAGRRGRREMVEREVPGKCPCYFRRAGWKLKTEGKNGERDTMLT